MNILCEQCAHRHTPNKCAKCRKTCCWRCINRIRTYINVCDDCFIPYKLLEKINA